MNNKLTMLMILDGYGINENTQANAIAMANTPVMDKLMKQNPHTQIKTSGLDVGLPEGISAEQLADEFIAQADYWKPGEFREWQAFGDYARQIRAALDVLDERK